MITGHIPLTRILEIELAGGREVFNPRILLTYFTPRNIWGHPSKGINNSTFDDSQGSNLDHDLLP
jgi:hypothetical protein